LIKLSVELRTELGQMDMLISWCESSQNDQRLVDILAHYNTTHNISSKSPWSLANNTCASFTPTQERTWNL